MTATLVSDSISLPALIDKESPKERHKYLIDHVSGNVSDRVAVILCHYFAFPLRFC